jgi:hypothetical protein
VSGKCEADKSMSTACSVRRLDPPDVVAPRREALALHPLAFSASPPDDPELLIDSFRPLLASPAEAALFGALVADTLVGMVGVVRNKGAKERHKALIWGMYVRAIDPYISLVDVLQRIDTHPAFDVHLLIPCLWKPHFADNPLRSDLDRLHQYR